MDWSYVRIWGMILVLTALSVALVWGLGYAVYLNRVGSRGWGSTRRLLLSALVVFSITLPVAVAFREGPALWALASGRLGSAEGQFQTGALYQAGSTFLRSNPVKAVEAFRRAAEQGHTQAQVALAQACFYGRGTVKDIAAALRWARAGAKAGHPLAMVLAGEILLDSSPAEAESYFRQAAPLLRVQARLGEAQACFALGHLHRSGLGVTQDPVEALTWMLLAQRLGISPFQAFAVQKYEQSLTLEQQAQARTRAEVWIQAKGKT